MTYLGTSARNSVDIHARTVSRASADPMIFRRGRGRWCRSATGERGAERILAHRRVYPVDLVRDHRAGVADPVDEDAPIGLAVADGERGGVGEVGQVAGQVVVRAEVGQLVVAEDALISSLSENPA